jgi:hypothetical protein
MKTFLENRYGKNQKEENETKISAVKVEQELSKLIISLVNYVPPDTRKMSKREKEEVEIKQAAIRQAQVFFRKALREFEKGTRYLR